jgi:hypothetical protein
LEGESAMAILESGIIKSYNKFFILEEDSLRRIQAILEKAAKILPDSPEIVFRVEREDNRFYETLNLGDVLGDPNVSGRRVVAVSLQLPQTKEQQKGFIEDRQIVNIGFTSEKKRGFFRNNEIYLKISHDDRTWALLLADELEPQIQRTFKAKGIPTWIFLLFLIPVAMVVLRLYQKVSPELAKNVTISIGAILFLIFFFEFFKWAEGPPRWYSRLIGPESVFLWGDEVYAYNARQKAQQNFFWGVLVAFIVSFAAGGFWFIY